MPDPALEPFKKPENWTDLLLALVVGALAYVEEPHLRIALVLAAVGLRVVARWWGDPNRPLPTPAEIAELVRAVVRAELRALLPPAGGIGHDPPPRAQLTPPATAAPRPERPPPTSLPGPGRGV